MEFPAAFNSLHARGVCASVYELFGWIQQIHARDVQKAFHKPADFSSPGIRLPAEASFSKLAAPDPHCYL